ncbi:MAG TPA: MaoC family dehydratase [Vicinamibacteria bacterium]|jgi:acyl dehydratase
MGGGRVDWTGLDRLVGRELGVTDWLLLDQDRIDRFAEATGDRQWIHVDVERAKKDSPLGSTIAHGFLSLSLLARFGFEIGLVAPEGSHLLNYGLNRVRFAAPVRAGARVRDRIVLLEVEEKGAGRTLVTTRHTIEIEGEEKPALVAESLVLLVTTPSRP